MIQIDKDEEIQKTKVEKSKGSIEWRNLIRIEHEEEEESSSLISMYILNLDKEDSHVPSHQSPIVILHDSRLLMHLEKVHSSPVMEKILFERHSVIQEDHPSSYNIEEIFDSFTFNLGMKEVSQKRV